MFKRKKKKRGHRQYTPLLALILVIGVASGAIFYLTRPTPLPDTLTLPAEFAPTAEYLEQNPLPVPEVFSLWEEECFQIMGDSILEPGDRRMDYDDIKARTSLRVDDYPLAMNGLAGTMLTSLVFTDSDGNSVVTSDMFVCFSDIPRLLGIHLTPGLHMAMVEVTTTSGIVYSHTWTFRVE